MSGTGRLLIGFAAAALVAAFTAVILLRVPALFLPALLVAVLHVAALAAPAYLALRKRFAPSAPAVLAGAFLTGAVPAFLLLGFVGGSGGPGTNAWINGVQTISDGERTLAGWLRLLEAVGSFGACGLAGGLVFWLITKTPDPAE